MTEEVRKWLEGCSHILEFPWEDQQWEDQQWEDQQWEEEDVDEEGGACEGKNRREEEEVVGDPTLGEDDAEDCVRIGAKNGEGSVTLK